MTTPAELLTDAVLDAADSACGRVYREYMEAHKDVRILDFPPEVKRAARAAQRTVLLAALQEIVPPLPASPAPQTPTCDHLWVLMHQCARCSKLRPAPPSPAQERP